ncbi:protein spire homolog 1-like [Oppia nitens]|uniref:protein spire homolog 1-like n=1 Tax=Oppia nitens TaxID=1686743 RepID=UPI0023D9915D|nr:protein spire homolog 1-like [Oppia nitens]
MSVTCVPDEDNCFTLDSIVKALRTGIAEEQVWAVIHQSLSALKEDISQDLDSRYFRNPDKIYIKTNGCVHTKTWSRFVSQDYDNSSVSVMTVMSSLAPLIYKALDYDSNEKEEVCVTKELENAFELLMNEEIDEGIDENEEIQVLNQLLDICCNRTDSDDHYRSVCRALVAEAIEISTFLNKISFGTQKLNQLNTMIAENNEDNDDVHVEVWAHLWMKVMRQLRDGTTLKNINTSPQQTAANIKQREYELTPYEMLLNDINSRRYSLKKVINLPKRVEKDARTLIMDFIRSRPPLRPVSERVLNPIAEKEKTLHEKLMNDIKQEHHLKPSPQPFERKFDSFHYMPRKRFSLLNETEISSNSRRSSSSSSKNDFQRFSFRNLSLRSGAINRIAILKPNPESTYQTTPQSKHIRSGEKSRRMSFLEKIWLNIW